jgi:CheY-like chemotaxis protein
VAESVLIIEDSPTQALRMQIALQSQGFAVEIANQSKEALEQAKVHPPDVVLSDVRMPGMNGFELAQAFQQDAALKSVPVLLTSATATEEEDKVEAERSGAKGLVEKGMDPAALAEALRSAIQGG